VRAPAARCCRAFGPGGRMRPPRTARPGTGRPARAAGPGCVRVRTAVTAGALRLRAGPRPGDRRFVRARVHLPGGRSPRTSVAGPRPPAPARHQRRQRSTPRRELPVVHGKFSRVGFSIRNGTRMSPTVVRETPRAGRDTVRADGPGGGRTVPRKAVDEGHGSRAAVQGRPARRCSRACRGAGRRARAARGTARTARGGRLGAGTLGARATAHPPGRDHRSGPRRLRM
jgi:hypothetical protein